MTRRFHVRPAEISGYAPANHTLTENKRLIGPETVGAEQMEVLLGTLLKGGAALPHAHPGIEQACYMLEGTATAEVNGQTMHLVPGDMCFFPADTKHRFEVTSDSPVRLLVIYAPPYLEQSDRVVKSCNM